MGRNMAALLLAGALLLSGCGAPLPYGDPAPEEERDPVPVIFREESIPDAQELFQENFPEEEVQVNPFDGDAISREIREVVAACGDTYRVMERQEDLLGRIFRPTRDQLEQVAEQVGALGYPVAGRAGTDLSTRNPQVLREFYRQVENGEDGECGVYELDSLGSLSRACFLYRDGTAYYGRVQFGWDIDLVPWQEEMGVVARLDDMRLTENGYFLYGSGKSGFAGVTNGYRLDPVDPEMVALRERYLRPLQGYYGHNVLVEDWDSGDLSAVNYNDVFETLYHTHTGGDPWQDFPEQYGEKPYERAIPGEEFEQVITAYFPVTAEELREWAVYDNQRMVYAWIPFTNSGYGMDWEVVDVRQNGDGSLALTVCAVRLHGGVDRVATNTLTVMPGSGGGFHYLSNRIQRNEEVAKWLPPHQHRVKKEEPPAAGRLS